MEVSEHWVYQGRQEHGWFGHGTAPKTDKDTPDKRGGRLFDLGGVGQRIDWVADSLVGHLSRQDRGRPAARIEGAARDQLKTAVAAWYGASGLSRDAFRNRLLDPHTSDTTVDLLRSAARGMVEATTHDQLNAAGADFAAAVQQIGLDRWPRFLGDASRRAVAAVSAATAQDPGKLATPGTGPLILAGSKGPFSPGGTNHVPIDGTDPLDPERLNIADPTIQEQQAVTATLNAIREGSTQGLNPHSYKNYPNSLTGAVLPPTVGEYTAYDVKLGDLRRGASRIIIDSATGAAYYTNNHYRSFFPIVISPSK